MLPSPGFALLDELLHLDAIHSASFLGIDDLRLLYRAYLALVVERQIHSDWGPVRAFDCGFEPDSENERREPWLQSISWFDEGLVLGDLHVEAGGGSRIAYDLNARHRNWSDAPRLVLLPISDQRRSSMIATARHHAYSWYFAASYLVLGVNRHAPVEFMILIDRLCTTRGLERVSSSG